MAMQGGIQTFVDKYGIEQKRVYPLQVCCEEMVYDFMNHCFAEGEAVDMRLEVSYAEEDHAVVIEITSGGKPYNPLEESDNAMAVAIIRRTAQRTDYRFDQNYNQLTIIL